MTRFKQSLAVTAALVLLAGLVYHHDLWVTAALLLLVPAALYDAHDGTIPIWILLGALLLAGVATYNAHRVPWLVLALLPLIYVAWKTHERAFGWGDVLTLAVIVVSLPVLPAIFAIVVGCAASLIVMRLESAKAGVMLPYLAVGAAVGAWMATF